MDLRHVLVVKFCEMSGYTPKAVERKIAEGKWLQGREFIRAPDGHIMVDLEGYERWVKGERVPV